jgi:hypothetical protein
MDCDQDTYYIVTNFLAWGDRQNKAKTKPNQILFSGRGQLLIDANS